MESLAAMILVGVILADVLLVALVSTLQRLLAEIARPPKKSDDDADWWKHG